MAITAKPTHSIVYSFRDDDGKNATSEIMVPAATTAANTLTFAAAYGLLLAALSDATMTGYNVVLGFAEAGGLTIGSSDIENKGLLLMNAANGVKSSITIPSVLESVLQPNNQDIDQTNADVADLLDALTLGLSGVQPCNLSGSDLVLIRDTYKQNRRSHVSGRVRKG